jgi:hypothetical protein
MSDKTHSNDNHIFYRFIEHHVKNQGKQFDFGHQSQPEQTQNNKLRDDIQESIDSINLTSAAIMALARTLSGFQLDSDTNNVIPGELKNGFITGGMLHAIEKLAEDISGSIEFLEDQHRDNAK